MFCKCSLNISWTVYYVYANAWVDDVIASLFHICFFLYTLQKVTQHDFDRLYLFNQRFIFVILDITGKPVYSPFDCCLICYDYFTGACVGEYIGGKVKMQIFKIVRIGMKMLVFSSFVFRFCEHNASVSHAVHSEYDQDNSKDRDFLRHSWP